MKNLGRNIVLILAILATSQSSFAQTCAVMYEHANYEGASYIVNNGENNPWIGNSWNDIVSSLTVLPGCQITLWQHINYGGMPRTFYSNTSYVGNDFNDITSGYTCNCH